MCSLEMFVLGKNVNHCPRRLQGVVIGGNRSFYPLKERPRKRSIGTENREVEKEMVNGGGSYLAANFGFQKIIPMTL